ncbi:MAG: MFS transporter, partial [Myxococcota bacterium]|nr:MFS transporter [Myxococcota bacterium]
MFLGWRMVAVAFVADFVAVGFMFYSFGVFLGAVEEDLGASRAEISWSLAISNLAGSFAAPLIGRVLDRLGVRRVMTAGACLMAAGFVLASQARALWQFHLAFGTLLALGAMSMGNLSAGKLVASWFAERRGTALGVATMGISLSGLAMPPLATWLILNLGWRGGFLVYAAGTLCVIAPLALLFVVERPEDVGQRPDGRPRPAEGEPPPPPERAFGSAEILRDPGFWRIVLPFALAFFSNSAVLTHVVQHALSLGIADYRAAFLLSCIAGAGVAGKVAFGRIADGL